MGWKRAVEEGGTRAQSARRPIDPWVVNAYFKFKYELAANTNKPKMQFDKFQMSVAAAVTVLCVEDPLACILHCDEPYSQTIREMPVFDRKYSTWSRFINLDNNKYFKRGTKDKSRVIIGTIHQTG